MAMSQRVSQRHDTSSPTLFNYATERDEEIVGGAWPTKRLREFIPQNVAVQNLYALRLVHGDTPINALEFVLCILCATHNTL